jgi:phospholipid/cholesterol/gamma-HCH transport system permease protein
MGILGGSVIGVTMLDLSLVEYLEQTRKSISSISSARGC